MRYRSRKGRGLGLLTKARFAVELSGEAGPQRPRTNRRPQMCASMFRTVSGHPINHGVRVSMRLGRRPEGWCSNGSRMSVTVSDRPWGRENTCYRLDGDTQVGADG